MKRSLARLPIALVVAALAPTFAAGLDPGSASAPADSTASPSDSPSSLVRHKIRLTYRGMTGSHGFAGDCPGAATTSSKDVFEGVVRGDEPKGAQAGVYSYVGDLERKTDLDYCDVKPAPDTEWTYCVTHLTGHGVMRATIDVQLDRPTGYVTLRWKKNTAAVDSAAGDCESELIAEIRQNYLEDGEGAEFALERTGLLRDGESYIQPSRGPGDPVGPWTLEILGSKKLRADPGGPYRVERGKELVLDGSRSEGDITDYTWKISMKDCKDDVTGQPVNGKVEKHGVRVKIRPLCAIDATLEVTDGTDRTEPVAAAVQFEPRDSVTKTIPTQGDLLDAGLVTPCGCELGRNICSVERKAGLMKSEHYYHKPESASTYEGSQYDLGKHRDPSGLFDGWWWVAKVSVGLARSELLNVLLTADTKLIEENQGATKDAFELLVASVRRHEAIHTELIDRAAKEHDPAPKIETMMQQPTGQPEQLRTCVDSIISQSEGHIEATDTEQAVIAQMIAEGEFDELAVVRLRKALSSTYAEQRFPKLARESDRPSASGGAQRPTSRSDWAPCSALSAPSIPSSNTSSPP